MTTDILRERSIEKTLKSCATFLARWRGARAVMRELTPSHKSLRILLTKGEGNENLLVSCVDPITIRGPVWWPSSDLRVSRATLPDGDDGFVVVDDQAGFEVYCGAVEVAENVKLW